jgi:hypothetical protein
MTIEVHHQTVEENKVMAAEVEEEIMSQGEILIGKFFHL